MDYCRFEKSAHKTTGQCMAYRCFYPWRQSWTVCPKSARGGGEGGGGEESSIKQGDYGQKLQTRTWEEKTCTPTGNENGYFKTLHQFKMLWPQSNKYWPAQAADFATYTKEKNKPSWPPFWRLLLPIHHVNSSSVSLGKASKTLRLCKTKL